MNKFEHNTFHGTTRLVDYDGRHGKHDPDPDAQPSRPSREVALLVVVWVFVVIGAVVMSLAMR